MLQPFQGETPNESVVRTLAYASQFIIGGSEAIIATALLGAAVMPRRRLALANFGLGYAIGLFSVFMLVMFVMHDPKLPKWNQYPAILARFAVTWLLVALTDTSARSSRESS